MSKISYDMKRSLRESPPVYEEGIQHIKRIVISIDSVDISPEAQVREQLVVLSNVQRIEESLVNKGYDYSAPVIVVQKHPDTKSNKEFLVLSGINRVVANERLNHETILVDVVECATPRLARTFSNKCNTNRSPFCDNSDKDFVYSIEKANEKGELDGTNDDDVKRFLEESGITSSKRREAILNRVRGKISAYGKYVHPYSAKDAKLQAKKLGLPYDGDKNIKSVPGLGLIVGDSWRSIQYQSETIAMKYPGMDIEVYGFISNPCPQMLENQRKQWLDDFNENLIARYYGWLADRLNIDESEVKTKVKKHPWKFIGFLAQDLKNEPEGVVDQYGNPVTLPDRKSVYYKHYSESKNVVKSTA